MTSNSAGPARFLLPICKAVARGFTLLEILVVMFIIGVIAAMATLSVGTATGRTGAEKEIQRVQDLIALASEEAVAQGREFGLTFYQKEYQFSAWDTSDLADPHWKPLEEDATPFGPRTFPPEAVVDLEVEGRTVKLAPEKPPPVPEKKKSEDEDTMAPRRSPTMKDKYRPQIILDSSGEIIPAFTLRLRPTIGTRSIGLKVPESGKAEQFRDDR